MFDQMKQMGALAGLLRNRDKLREISEEAQARISGVRARGESGGGAVVVVVTGRMQVEEVRLEPALVAGLRHDEGEGGKRMAEALIAEATNSALLAAQQLVQREIKALAEEHDLPDLPGMGGLDSMLGPG
ncbi:MAG: YbaB/EbfC family nucleoid-associated protein [Planctomycetota bacterium]